MQSVCIHKASNRLLLVRPLPTKSRNSWAHDVKDTCATSAGLVHDVKDTHQTQNGSALSRAFATFKRRYLHVCFNKLDYNSCERTAVSVHFIPFPSTGPVEMFFRLPSPLVPAGSPSRGGDVKVCVLDINQPSLPTPFNLFLCLFLSYGPFTCISFHKFSRHLSVFSLCSPSLISASLVLSTIYIFLKVCLNGFGDLACLPCAATHVGGRKESWRLRYPLASAYWGQHISGHSYLTHSFILRKEEAPVCVACNVVLTVKHILIECADLLETRKKYFEEKSLYSLFRNVIHSGSGF